MDHARRKRMNPKRLVVGLLPPGVDLQDLAARAVYVGSITHKRTPSFAGPAPSPRPNGSCCPNNLAHAREQCQEWLAQAIRAGHVIAWAAHAEGVLWRGGFPKYVFFRRPDSDEVFVAQELESGSGRYKGYPLAPDEVVKGLR